MSVATATKPASEPIPGYKLVKRIGAGGYGEVWSAEAPGQLVKAIKFVYGLLDEDRAARELKALNRIRGVRHPFLLSLERIEVVDGQLLIVTELADCSLKDRFEEHRKKKLVGIPRDELLRHMRDTADALDYMNEQHSLQHLDVKPENLLLLSNRIKVADFGLVKDIHDATVSMMGGLTPIYAPPEVFEGRPSRRSDQYSLAIVYQEMLTGVLPFPGRTAAQLAAQHLNAKPRLDTLPANDREVLARALSKKPADRFPSCVELVKALVDAGSRAPGQPAAGAANGRAPQDAGNAVTATRLPAEMLADMDAATSAVQQIAGDQPSPTVTRPPRPVRPTLLRPTLTASDGTTQFDRPAELEALVQSPPILDVPPPDTCAGAPTFRPTLFLGLGGCGSKVLRRVRRRLNDRLTDAQQALVPMLLLDTDNRELSNAAHGGEAGHLQPEETLALPLRRSQDYKEDSRRILEWLSRRWLFNIPKSLQTEGLRPLGRLAFVDHAPAITERLKQAIEKLHQDATKAQLFPRVVIVASPSGGTGGGMVADMALLARQIAEMLPEGAKMEVMAVLVHGTNRHAQQQELAGANTVATLTELAQFHRPGTAFPGDAACGLKPRDAGSGPLDAVYLIHAGEALSAEKIDAASDSVAEFLMLDTVTGAGNLLEACRLEISDSPGLRLRTFGLYQLGFAHDKLLDESVHRICRTIIQRLTGPEPTEDPKRTSILLRGGNIRSSDQPPVDPLADIDERASTLVRTMGLDEASLLRVVEQFSVAELGGQPDAFFQQLMIGGTQGDISIERWLQAADLLFGVSDPDAIKPRPGELAVALEEHSQSWVPQVGGGLREWIEGIVDNPHCRVIGARRAAKWLQAYFRGLAEKLVESKNRFARESTAPLQALRSPDAVRKGQKRPTQELTNAFMMLCQIRLSELAAQRAVQMVHALQSHIATAHDVLVDLQRELDQLSKRFPAAVVDSHATGPAAANISTMRSSIAEQLRLAEATLAAHVEEQLSQELFDTQGGLKTAITAGGESREELVETIRTRARQAALAKVASIDLTAALLANETGESPLASYLEQARPWLERCGGRRRLVFVLPEQLAAHFSPATLVSQLPAGTFKQLPGVAAGSASDLVLLYELSDISLPHAAAHLIDFRRDLAEAASRLQTRSDVTWTPVFGF